MDIDALHSALLSLTVLPEQIHAARENVSAANGGASCAFEEFLNAMERDLRIAKATLARELGFAVCHCCWPPELLTIDAGGHAYCPASPETAQAVKVPAHKASAGATSGSRAARARRLDAFTRSQKEKLLGLRDIVVDSIAGVAQSNRRLHANGSEAPAFVGDRADAGSDASERDFALSLLSQGQGALTEIDQALKRLESGAYGTCEMSGQAIPRARLEAIPFARYTVECQAQMEKRKGTKLRESVAPLLEVGEEGEEEDDILDNREPSRGQRSVALEYIEMRPGRPRFGLSLTA